jgi:glycosyltransferase involved in cell wall biosynthesis
MRIGIDATCWANDRGYGRFTRELVAAMVPQAGGHTLVCFLDDRSAARFSLDAPNIERIVVPQRIAPTEAAASGGGRSPFDMWRLTRAVRAARLDVFFSPSVYGYFPLPPGLPAVVTVMDAIVERFPELTLPTWKDRMFWKAKVALARRQADLILTLSDHSASEISALLHIDRSRIRVSLVGVSSEYGPSDSPADVRAAAESAGIPAGARWLTYVGGFGPHKYVDLLVRAHAAVARRVSSPLYLVLVGPNADAFHEDRGAIQRAIDESGSSDLVTWPGYLPDETIRHLHSGAVALILASAAEGFGLPAVEAARCGCPVIATTMSPLPQVLEGGGLFVQPGDLAALERAIATLATDEPARLAMGRRALERASMLSWAQSASIALETIEEAAGRRRRKSA